MPLQDPALRSSSHRTIWRLHFYAGLFAMPFILFLSITGSLYLFKPDIDRWEEHGLVHAGPPGTPVGADAQVAAALAANPGAELVSYRVPSHPSHAARVDLAWPNGQKRQVFVAANSAQITGSLDPDSRFTANLRSLHSELLLGERGSRLTELAASWAFVLVLTGLYLWWPRTGGLAGTLWPRLQPQARWRDLHAVTGVWISAFVLLLLITALPWTGVWGEAFRALRETAGAPAPKFAATPRPERPKADWATRHDTGPTQSVPALPAGALPLETFAKMAPGFAIAPPHLLVPPGVRGPDLVIASEAPSLAARSAVFLDPGTGFVTRTDGLKDRPILSRVVILGISWHEGHLLGRLNQAIGLLTAIGLVILCISSFRLWRARRPAHGLGAPPPPSKARTWLLLAILVPAGLLLPLLGASLLVVLALEQALRIVPAGRVWLGLRPR